MPEDFAEGRLLRRPGPSMPVPGAAGARVADDRLRHVLRDGAVPLLLHAGAVHAEGPIWQASHRRLLWSDVANRRLNAWYPDGRVEVVIDATHFMNGNAIAANGDLIHCEHGRRCISMSDADGSNTRPLAGRYRGRRLNSPNDVAVSADGAIWFTDPTFGILMPAQGSLAAPDLDHRSLYRLDPNSGEIERKADFEEPNGIAFSRDGRRLYVTDTAHALGEVPGGTPGRTREIVAFDLGADGALAGRRTFWQADAGVPDGLAVDGRGWVWTSAGDGIHILSTSGEALGFVPTPEVATNCAFGPDDGRLFITAGTTLLALDLL